MLQGLILQERSMRPRMNERDLAKLLYQAAMGGDHLLEDRRGFLEGLRSEWDGLDPESPRLEPPLQPISPQGGVWRAHLLPLKLRGCDAEALFELLAGQPLLEGSRDGFLELLRRAAELAEEAAIPFSARRLHRCRDRGGPIHHSRFYSPCAYRVVNDPGTALSLLRLISR
ncbi:MAG: hypothetical protein ACQETZ_09020 [Candidatus Fermentibacterota bacterium]